MKVWGWVGIRLQKRQIARKDNTTRVVFLPQNPPLFIDAKAYDAKARLDDACFLMTPSQRNALVPVPPICSGLLTLTYFKCDGSCLRMPKKMKTGQAVYPDDPELRASDLGWLRGGRGGR